MIAMAVAMGIGRFVYTPILPGMMEELHLSPANAGWIASANYLGYLVGALAAAGGWAHGRERLLMLAALGASTVLAALMGLTDTMVAFLVIRFLAGLASAFVMVFMASIVFSHINAAGRGDLQAWHFGGVGLGIAISAAMMAVLVTEHAGWAAGWLWSAAISACGFVVVALLANEGPLANGEAVREPALPKDRSLMKIIVAYGLFGFGYVVTATFLVAIVRQGGGSRVFEAMVWLVAGLAGFPSTWLWQKIAARIGLYAAYALACFVEVDRRHRQRGAWRTYRATAWRPAARRHLHCHHRAWPAGRRPAGAKGAPAHLCLDDGVVRPWPDHRPDRRRAFGAGVRQFLPRFDRRRGHAGRLRRHHMVGRAKIAMICGLARHRASGRHFLSP